MQPPNGSAGRPTAPVLAGRPLVSPTPNPLRHRARPHPSFQRGILALRLPSRRTVTRLLHTFDYGQSCKSEATPTHPIQRDTWRPDLKRLPWSVTCLSPTRQGELLATQNPDGSLVFSAVLKDEQELLSFLLVPPSPKRTPRGHPHAGKSFPALGSRRPVGRHLAF
jgi:hypothetical protein